MAAWAWILIAVVAIALIVAGLFAWSRMRTRRLRTTFGPEYERAVGEGGSRREAEAALDERRKRREELDIKPLPPQAAGRYREEWRAVQRRFVDDPVAAVGAADGLVEEVMAARGYPMDEFEAQAELISVDHPDVVENYRAGHEIYRAFDRGDASTEDLRQAMVHYRALFTELLDIGEDDADTASTEATNSTETEVRR